MTLDWIAVTAIATVLLAGAPVWLGWQTRGATEAAREELEELRTQRRAADAEREQERRRTRRPPARCRFQPSWARSSDSSRASWSRCSATT